MIHLFTNALAASAGGGLTYVRNVIPQFAAVPDLRVTVALSPSLRCEFGEFPNVEFLELDIPPARRFWYEQLGLAQLIRGKGATVLLSAGNFALRKSPVPQILLSRNSLYVSPDFFRDLRARGEYRTWLDTKFRAILAKRSIHWSEVTVAPSQAFASELERWSAKKVMAIHHGFDREAFTRDSSPLSPEVEAKLKQMDDGFKILFVSHYNYYRNFETLIRALPMLRDRMGGEKVRLLLTCRLAAGLNPGTYRPDTAESLINKLGVSDMVVELGAIPYQTLHRLYARANVYVTPAYTETFAHPLVEAMASGVPVIAADIAVHREICGDAAIYFERFSPEALADRVLRISNQPEERRAMIERGLGKANNFSWKTHVVQIIELCRRLMSSR